MEDAAMQDSGRDQAQHYCLEQKNVCLRQEQSREITTQTSEVSHLRVIFSDYYEQVK